MDCRVRFILNRCRKSDRTTLNEARAGSVLPNCVWLSMVFLLPAGFSLMVLMASTNTLIQTIVPDQLRGRVMALHVTMFIGMFPFGSFLAGAIAERLGAPAAVAIGACSCLLGSLILGLRVRRLQISGVDSVQAHMDE